MKGTGAKASGQQHHRSSSYSCLNHKPAEIVGVREMCGEPDFSVELLDRHYVFGAFVSHFAGPVAGTQSHTFRLEQSESAKVKLFTKHTGLTTAQVAGCAEMDGNHNCIQISLCQSSSSPR